MKSKVLQAVWSKISSEAAIWSLLGVKGKEAIFYTGHHGARTDEYIYEDISANWWYGYLDLRQQSQAPN